MDKDREFLEAFESQRLPRDRWGHREHVRTAYLYLTQYSFDEAADRMRAGIKAYNAANDIEDTLDTGYHETVTIAWLRLIAAMLREYGTSASSEAFCNEHPELGEKKRLRLFYSRDRITTAEAKAGFVEPDLAPLP